MTMKFLNHMSPRQNLLRLVLGHTITIAKPLADFATWLLTGAAAILAAIVVNIAAVSSVLSPSSIRWGLALLVVSLLLGAITRQIGLAVVAGLSLVEVLYEALQTPEGVAVFQNVKGTPEEIKTELASAFLPPLRGMMKRSYERGSQDALAAEKRLAKLFSVQLYAFWLQSLSSAAGLLILGFGVR